MNYYTILHRDEQGLCDEVLGVLTKADVQRFVIDHENMATTVIRVPEDQIHKIPVININNREVKFSKDNVVKDMK